MNLRTQTTLLDLVQSISKFANSDEEVVVTVAYLINSGRVKLCGNFAGAKISFASPLDVFPAWARPNLSPPTPPRPALAA